MLVRMSLLGVLIGCAEVDAERVAEIVSLEGDAVHGEATFDDNCRGCHGPEGVGVLLGGPSLQSEAWAAEEVVAQVLVGGFGMPAFEGELSDEEIADVAAYVADVLSQPEVDGAF
ncbi:hypothetical protein LBMAG42_21700 [Deltaproteobacteria bacterium]|nr:hypothetical protein LBMAG42_21700 [Deltaproteobacteria bacterium]